MDAAAVTTQVFLGTPFERQSIANLSLLINEAGRLPLYSLY
jgi:DhnA family fructose-bisphosphate aldolase class Ia